MLTDTQHMRSCSLFGFHRTNDVCVSLQGLLSDDSVLAAALWRNLFTCQCEDPRQLELMVEYVRKQVSLRFALCTYTSQYLHY